MKEYCPNCGLPMEKLCVTKNSKDEWIVTYACPNHYKCGTVIKKNEGR